MAPLPNFKFLQASSNKALLVSSRVWGCVRAACVCAGTRGELARVQSMPTFLTLPRPRHTTSLLPNSVSVSLEPKILRIWGLERVLNKLWPCQPCPKANCPVPPLLCVCYACQFKSSGLVGLSCNVPKIVSVLSKQLGGLFLHQCWMGYVPRVVETLQLPLWL